MIRHCIRAAAAAVFFLCALPAFALAPGEKGSAPAAPEQTIGQTLEQRLASEYLKADASPLDVVKGVSHEFLRRKKFQKLTDIAATVRAQRQTAQDFEGFFAWMSANLAGYNQYIKATSYAAAAAKFLPVPYAGQASNFAKFAGQFTVALNNASSATTRYLQASQKFLAMVAAIDPAKPLDDRVLAEAHRFADQTLLKEMEAARKGFASVSEFSSGALSFLTGLNDFAGETAAYWNKVKGLVKKETDAKDKNYLAESVKNLKTQAERFHGRFAAFDDLAQKETAGVKSLVVYDELAAEIAGLKWP